MSLLFRSLAKIFPMKLSNDIGLYFSGLAEGAVFFWNHDYFCCFEVIGVNSCSITAIEEVTQVRYNVGWEVGEEGFS